MSATAGRSGGVGVSVYVDLNPIRAGIAETPETSTFTSAYERIQTLAETATTVTDGAPVSQVGTVDDGRVHGQRVGRATPSEAGEVRTPHDGWLSPVELQGDGAAKSRPAERRASNKGFLPLKLEQYLELLDWTGRQTRPDKRGQIPAELLPILQRLRLSTNSAGTEARLFRKAGLLSAAELRNVHLPDLCIWQLLLDPLVQRHLVRSRGSGRFPRISRDNSACKPFTTSAYFGLPIRLWRSSGSNSGCCTARPCAGPVAPSPCG